MLLLSTSFLSIPQLSVMNRIFPDFLQEGFNEKHTILLLFVLDMVSARDNYPFAVSAESISLCPFSKDSIV